MRDNKLAYVRYLAEMVRTDVYGRRSETGYVTVRDKLAPTVIERHVENRQPIGAYLMRGDRTRIAVIDFDDHDGSLGWEAMCEAAARVLALVAGFGLRPHVFVSGGGKGIHIWFVWEDPQPAKFVRHHLANLVAAAGYSVGARGVAAGAVEVFPKQDRVDHDGLGSMVALPGARASAPLSAESLERVAWESIDIPEVMTRFSAPCPEVAAEELEPASFVRLPGDEELVASALAATPSDDYHEWIRGGHALKGAFGEDGYDMFAAWSAKSAKYPGDEKLRRLWTRLKPNGSVGLGSIFHMARKARWNGSTNPLIREMNAKYGIYTHGRTTEIIIKDASGGPEDVFIGKAAFMDRLAGDAVRRGTDEKAEWVPKSRIWLSHSKAAHYTRVVFDPSLPPGHNGDVWNLWRGFAVEPRPGDWSLLKAHIRDNISRGDGAIYDWLLNWMALGVQQPALVIGTAPVLIGFPGTGKGLLAHAYGALWSPHYASVTHSEQVTGRFSGHFFARRFVFIDEGTFGGNRKDAGVIKARITEPVIMLERKGIDAVSMKNCMIFMIASNEASVVPADKGDRRWMVIDVGDRRREDRAYFGAIVGQLEAGGYAAMLHELLHRDTGQGPDPRKTIKTEALFEQMLLAQPPQVRYLHGILDQGRLPQNWIEGAFRTTIRAMVEELHHLYRHSMNIDSSSLGRFIHKAVPEVRTSQGGTYFVKKLESGRLQERSMRYEFPPLDRARAAFAKFVNMPIVWSAVDEWQLDPDPEEGNEADGVDIDF